MSVGSEMIAPVFSIDKKAIVLLSYENTLHDVAKALLPEDVLLSSTFKTKCQRKVDVDDLTFQKFMPRIVSKINSVHEHPYKKLAIGPLNEEFKAEYARLYAIHGVELYINLFELSDEDEGVQRDKIMNHVLSGGSSSTAM